MLLLISLFLGILGGIFLQWWILAAILGFQFIALFNLAFPDNSYGEKLFNNIFKITLAFQVPAWILYAILQHGAAILHALSLTIR